MSKKGENIYKRKDGRWEGRYIRYYDNRGKAKYGYVYAKTYGEVKSKLIEVKKSLGSNEKLVKKITAYTVMSSMHGCNPYELTLRNRHTQDMFTWLRHTFVLVWESIL